VAETPLIDIRPDHWEIVRDILRRHVPQFEVWAFGSRAKWSAKPYSDLDLAVITDKALSLKVSAALADDFSESDLPWKVDVVDWATTSESFRQIIEEDKIVVQRGARHASAAVVPRTSNFNDWRAVRLGDWVAQGAMSISDGYRVRNEELGPKGIPFVRGGDIRDGWINTDTEDHIRPELSHRVRAKLAKAGDVAFITKGTVGRAGYLRSGQPTVVFAPQVAYWRVLAPDVLNARFLFYLIRSHAFQSALNGVKTHGSMVADYVSISLQVDFEFKFPPIGEQRAIAHILGALDDKIELNRRMNETLETIARALFKSWFADFDPVRAKAEGRDPSLPESLAGLFPTRFVDSELGEIPDGWEVKSLDEIARFLNGLALQKYPVTDGPSLPVIKIAQLHAGNTNGSDRASAKLEPDYIVQDGDILFSWSGSLECVLWAGGPGALNQHLFKVTSAKYPRWLCYLGIHQHLDDFRHIAAGKATTMGHIQRHHLSEAKLPIPPPELMRAISAVIEPMIESIWRREVQSNTLATLRDTLLPKLIAGKLRVPDAERFVETAA
jgi:type I restriction enzyme S subunit